MAVAMLAISRIVSMDIASKMSKSGGACRSLCAINCPAPTYARQTHVRQSSEREECGGNPITRKEPTDKKLWGHVHLRGWGVRECEGYKTPKITVISGSVRFATPFMFLSVAVNKGSHYFSLASVSEESKNLVDTRIRHLC